MYILTTRYELHYIQLQGSKFSIDPAFSVDVGTAPASIGQIPDSVSLDEINDGATPNLSGRVAPDTDGMRSKLLSCRNHAFISSFNTRTLNPSSRLSELVLNAKLHKIDIIAIQEHHFFHPDDAIKYHKVEDFQLVTASSSKNTSNASVGGVGLLLSPRAMENLSKVEAISPQVVIADFEGNPKTSIISCHSPHNNSSEDDIGHLDLQLKMFQLIIFS